jgi:hypothetical protein
MGCTAVPESPPDLSGSSDEELIALVQKVEELTEMRSPLVHAFRTRGMSWNEIVAATGWPRSSIRRWHREYQSPRRAQ